jgi:hypothetical protein
MGGAKAGWDLKEWVPLCTPHHDILDARNGVSRARCHDTETARGRLRELAPVWWARVARAAVMAAMSGASVMDVLRLWEAEQ